MTTNFSFHLYPPINKIDLSGCSDVLEVFSGTSVDSESHFAIYISVPWCHSQCNSCSYFISTIKKGSRKLEEYALLLEKQIDSFRGLLSLEDKKCHAIYFGGGTASLLDARLISNLIQKISSAFTLSSNCEITLEGNPLDFRYYYLEHVRETGVNRLSIGLQSLDDGVLKILNSPHNAGDGINALENALRTNFITINTDLIYGIPSQSYQSWIDTLEKVVELHPQSITRFNYIIYPESKIEKLISEGKLPVKSDDKSIIELMDYTKNYLEKNNYKSSRYTNASLHGASQEYGRIVYQENCNLIGLGVNSYGFVNGYQYHSTRNIRKFCDSISKNNLGWLESISPPATQRDLIEKYTISNLYDSFIYYEKFQKRFSVKFDDVYGDVVNKLIQNRLLKKKQNYLQLTNNGIMDKFEVLRHFINTSYLS